MGLVSFTLRQEWPVDASRLWAALADWQGHSAWIPATSVRILEGDGGPGTVFVARTGIGPLGFDDRMRVVEFDAAERHAVVEKIGPLLTGSAGFRVEEHGTGSRLIWFETVRVPGLPQVFAPIANRVGAVLFKLALGRLRSRL